MMYYIYRINFLLGEPKGRYYIGKHFTKDINDGYVGSGRFCKDYFKHYKKIEGVTYTKEILCYCSSKEELAEKEIETIGNLYEIDPLCMNMKKGGDGGWNITSLSEEHKRKISANHVGMLGKNHTEEAKLKISKGQIGKSCPGHIHSEEEKIQRKLSLAQYYSTHSGTCAGKHRVYHSDGRYHYE